MIKSALRTLILATALLTLNTCSSDDEIVPKLENNSNYKILNLGASRVEGARPQYESYRYELWKDLKENGWFFDFIGTQSDEASYPLFNSDSFDKDHEGRGGWTSGQILEGLNDWLNQTGSPDIVLFSSPGGNDGLNGLSFEKAVLNINAIIDILQENNTNVIIIIEQMSPGSSDIMTPELTSFINNMRQEVLNMAINQTTLTSKVIAVDMFTGFDDSLLADDVHYNLLGAEFIASRYYNVLKNVLD
ncbi:GDSL-type esterase/lipase family protein [Tenacibaculum sp. C7A-26P2]|uniref:GDSL-type esterase/lipase family protein n=1 Tax=Tenacibaculum sp. C7A-26P2 TaxID=3447504 RepID=UPI003F870A1D